MFVIPAHQLPPGFAERIEALPAEPAVPRPASTAVLLRDGEAGPEALLLKRNHSVAFVPGAYVFPGGRVDASDSRPELLEHVAGLAAAAEPAAEFWIAALREVFEETGALLGERGPNAPAEHLREAREALLGGRSTMLEVVDALDLRLDISDVVYLAHWITPVVEPRRYDTCFFLARWPAGHEVSPDPRETTAALWLPPVEALERFRAGRLPMVFPTVKTLEQLRASAP